MAVTGHMEVHMEGKVHSDSGGCVFECDDTAQAECMVYGIEEV